MKNSLKIKHNFYHKVLLLIFTIPMLLLFQNCSEDDLKINDVQSEIKNSHTEFQEELNSKNPELAYPNTIGELITINPNSNNSIFLEKIRDEYIFSGDIILTKEQLKLDSKDKSYSARTGLSDISKRWANCTVYYTINSTLTNQTRITEAIEHWETNYNINFVLRTNQANYIEFVTSTGCSSFLGMIGGRQEIRLAPECSRGNTIHEIGHALGFLHEQQRLDRDNSINVNFGNIITGYEDNFKKYNQIGYNGFEIGQLDFGSIMLYGSYAFSSNNLPTITKLDGSTFIGQRNGLSIGDLEMIDEMYSCSPPPPPSPRITATGPTYMGGTVNMISWSYTGNVPNVQSIRWWYKKVNNGGALPILIGTGSTAYFMALPDTFYSDTGLRTSDFEIYLEVWDTDDKKYTSSIYNIMKKGKYKLGGAL